VITAGRPRAVVLVVVAFVVVFLATVGLARPRPAHAAGGPDLGGRCMKMAGAGHAGCRAAAPPAPARVGFGDLGGAYGIYRMIGRSDDHRQCRLQPTCSLFTAQAARRVGFWRGLLMGLARTQMSHSDQGGLLPASVASDGRFIYFDPVDRWIHGAL
jgi:hypothetical protein